MKNTHQILVGDCVEMMKTIEENSVHCCVTSPPYYGLRDYGHDGQIGLEETPEQFVEKLVEVFRGVRRVLRDDGTVWLNLGDSYNASQAGNKTPCGFSQTRPSRMSGNGDQETVKTGRGLIKSIKPKDLIGIPWMVAFALRDDGWYLRQDIIWHKPNPMPESVIDRCTKSHEYIFLLSKSKKYYYDADAIKEPITDSSAIRLMQNIEQQKGSGRVPGKTNGTMKAVGRKNFDSSMGGGGSSFVGHSGYKKADGTLICDGNRNKRSVWTITTKPYKEAHFATYPQDLIVPCIKAGCPEGGVVLDPFGGAGTTALVARKLNRSAIMCELNPDYAEIAEKRLSNELGIFV